MRFTWKKLGRIFNPETYPRHDKLLTHAANPLPVHLGGDLFRIYYSGRDENNRSSVGVVDVDLQAGAVKTVYHEPVFLHGPPGSFYADGVSIGNCYSADGKTYMLFMGWQVPQGGHWRGDIGRLVVDQSGALTIDGNSPFMGVASEDPVSLSYPWVSSDDEGFTMWYGSTVSWDGGNGEMIHVINSATSDDGHNWLRHGLAVPYRLGLAQAFSHPTVLKHQNGDLSMWFSCRSGRGEKYRIGYAEKAAGEDWRLDLENSGIDVADDGWDSEMIAYPFVFQHRAQTYMLYNGNGFGLTGFGLAVLEN